MDGAKKKKKHTNMNKCPYTNGALHTIYKIEIEQKTRTHIYQKRLIENKDQNSAEKKKEERKNLGEIINEEAFVIQHETEYYHCWIDRNIG